MFLSIYLPQTCPIVLPFAFLHMVLTMTTQRCYYLEGDKMAKTETLHIRIEPEIKKKAEETLKSLGITTTEAINIYLHQIILNQGLPFDVKLPKPNLKTMQAMKEALVLNEKTKSYDDISSLMEDLDS
jgi:DNA-damage-inducible protein J